MAVMDGGAVPEDLVATLRRSVCVPTTTVRNSLCEGSRKSVLETTRSQRILTATSRLGAAINIFFVLQTITIGYGLQWIGLINVLCAAALLLTPRLYRFGELLAPLAFFTIAYLTIVLICLKAGTGSGVLFYFVITGAIVLLVLGIEHLALASTLATVAVATAIVLELNIPENTGSQPDWAFRATFVITTITAGLMVMATVWYALRENTLTQNAIQSEFQRSEALLANILPESIAQRLKDPATRSSPTNTTTPQFCSPTSPDTPNGPATPPPPTWCASWTPSTPNWTHWLITTDWRRSRPAATPTWWSVGCHIIGPTIWRRWPAWRWICRKPCGD